MKWRGREVPELCLHKMAVYADAQGRAISRSDARQGVMTFKFDGMCNLIVSAGVVLPPSEPAETHQSGAAPTGTTSGRIATTASASCC